MNEVNAFASLLVEPGRINALSQKLIALTVPGVPDIYEGTELWDLSLVDPDNRRPVDFDERRRLLDGAAGLSLEQALAEPDRGLPKLLVLHRALAVRRELPGTFGQGSAYTPLAAAGPHPGRGVAYTRGVPAAG